MSSLLGTSADWYLMRASGFVTLVLLTATLALGVANAGRLARRSSTRTVAALVHRNASMLAVVFLGLHVLTAISDRYVDVPALSIVVPGVSGYDPLWTGLGALSLDLLVAVIVTSLLRARLRQRTWQLVHWMAYLCWPTALVHSIGSGSGTGADTGAAWSTVIYALCTITFVLAVTYRLARRSRRREPVPPASRPPYRRPVTPPGGPVPSRPVPAPSLATTSHARTGRADHPAGITRNPWSPS